MVFARAATYVAGLTPPGKWLASQLALLAPFEWIGTGLLAFFLGPIAARLLNGGKQGRDLEKRVLIEDYDSGFLRLAQKALGSERPLMLTMDNRKVYVGYVVRTPPLNPHNPHIGLLPILSGYRTEDTLELCITTNYLPAYERLGFFESQPAEETAESGPATTNAAGVAESHLPGTDEGDFVITLPLNAIVAGTFFDLAIYDRFFRQAEPDQRQLVDASGNPVT